MYLCMYPCWSSSCSTTGCAWTTSCQIGNPGLKGNQNASAPSTPLTLPQARQGEGKAHMPKKENNWHWARQTKCLYACIYVCAMYNYVCLYVCVQLCMCTTMYVSMYVSMYISMYVSMYLCMSLCIYECLYVWTLCNALPWLGRWTQRKHDRCMYDSHMIYVYEMQCNTS